MYLKAGVKPRGFPFEGRAHILKNYLKRFFCLYNNTKSKTVEFLFSLKNNYFDFF